LILATTSKTPAGTYTVTVTATGGTTTHSIPVTLVISVQSTTTLFSDGFEGSGWPAIQTLGNQGAWTLVSTGLNPSTTPHSGAKIADFNSHKAISGSQTRIYRTTGILIPATATTVALKFWMYHDTGYATSTDSIQPQISTNASS